VLVEETPHVLAKGLALFLLHHCQVWLPIRVLLHRSPCASRHQVSCDTSQVVPGAHRVVGPGTHRGSGPREVHTTPTWDPNGIFCGTGRRGLRCAIGHEWPAAPNVGDCLRPRPRVAQRVQGKNPLGFRVYRQVLGEMP
jgi:hypothetical protein